MLRLFLWCFWLKCSSYAFLFIIISFSGQRIWWFWSVGNDFIFCSTEILSCSVIFSQSVLWEIGLFLNFGFLGDNLWKIFEFVLLKRELFDSFIKIGRVISWSIESWGLRDCAFVHAVIYGPVIRILFVPINIFKLIFKHQDLFFKIS